jgi:hypothetical protein
MIFKEKYNIEIIGAFIAILILLFTLFKGPSVPSQKNHISNKTKISQVTSNLNLQDSYYKDYSLLGSRNLFSENKKAAKKSTIKGLPPLSVVLKKKHRNITEKRGELILTGVFYDGNFYHAVFLSKKDEKLLFGIENMRLNNDITILKIRKNVVELLKNGKRIKMQLFNIKKS